MKNVKARNSSTLSVHSLLPYLVNNFPDWFMFPPVDISSSRVASTLLDDATSCSNVAALFCVVSDKCLVMDSIFSVTLSCWLNRLARFVEPELPLLTAPPVLWRNSEPDWGLSWFIENSSCLSERSISNIVEIFAFRNAWVVLYSWSLWPSTALPSSTSPSSFAKLSNRSIHLRIAVIFSRPASFKCSSSGRVPRKARMSWNKPIQWDSDTQCDYRGITLTWITAFKCRLLSIKSCFNAANVNLAPSIASQWLRRVFDHAMLYFLWSCG